VRYLGHESSRAGSAAVAAHAVAQFGSGAEQAALRGGNGNTKHLGYLRHRKLLHISQKKDIPKQRRRLTDLLK
jgi:hypothetical protein